ncbi:MULTISPECIES: OstA-like protein [Chryseobacterium]|uniref:Lipopolysaccharide export system protein LptA n=1 Tax=Chryseobacterium camelliae TaxID=1265445 RepID=A0ABU0TJX3_9FLAO|nr:lipopolysaccharide export system protein LptA [Chryseobacterium camelliae]MDQ1101280.1 lipopolysaccharide export system protein LptA [Chryseobacterium sp. SORGH_AS_1048]MDR6084725.1 lipopolysaccharide export system protein LptA [Chryseobacterium sp. SORGH_AS_0909]MDR6132998.1 lipopolysaccharide export system protein LptA [Chryseobacterium sp. SORGH_AS_1175]MDT3408796.1 lipopolysaccharide export system protein LptA [Pseudacidovorax intermedius]
MRFLFVLLFFISMSVFAQDQLKPAQRDPYLQNPVKNAPPPQLNPQDRVHIINADKIIKDPAKYDGNRYLTGNVKIEHQGSILTADEVVIYDEENFVKAIGNTRLQNTDGSVITAGEMEYDANTQKGVARKNVVLTDPKQTIKTDILYYDRLSSQAYFNTGGTITDGQNVMYTKSATYFLNTKMIDFVGNVKIDSPDYIIEGPNIKQDQNTKIAEFFGPTTITSRKNPRNRVYTERGTYRMNTKEAFLKKNSKIFYNDKILTGDDMYYNQITGFGTATGNVTLDDPNEKRYIKGGYGEIFEVKDSAMMTKNPYAVKIFEKDSLYFASEKIISFQRPDSLDATVKKSFLRAFRKARFYKSNAQGRADSIAFNETDGVMHMYREPYLWSGEKQVTGDKVEAYFNTKTENIDSLKVLGNAFAISKVDSLSLKDEFNQVKGKLMTVYYQNNNIKEAKVIGNAQSIVYVDDENQQTKKPERVGITLSTCGIIGALFEEKALQIISCSVGANSDTYPMSMIEPAKRKFPDFNWNTKDRIRKWQDILVDSPNYEEIKYQADTSLYDQVQENIEKEKAKEEAKKPKRTRR